MWKSFIFALALLEWTTVAQQPSASDQIGVLRLDVNLIQVQVTVLDSSGHPVTGLGKDAFQLFVDDVQQPISLFRDHDSPVTAGVLVDNSASMFSKGAEVRAAALAFARASNPQDQMFVIHFSDQARLGLPSGQQFTGDVAQLEEALGRFTAAGTTALYDAVVLAFSQLRMASMQYRVLLIVSDGGDNSSHATLDDVLKLATACGCAIYAIGIYDETDRDRNPRVLSQLAEATGGAAFFPSQLQEVTATCVRIAELIRRQYTLGFKGQEDGEYHRIKVTVQDPQQRKLEVRTRGGYVAPKSSVSNAGTNP